jgi:serine/threonine protein kinase
MAGGQVGGEVPEATGVAVLTPGQTFNHYRIERELGRGGMGVVYEAVHQPLDKRVALKVLPVLAGQGPSYLERFLREARTAAALHHTNIVPVFDIGQAGGTPYYAMQYIRGRGLDHLLRDLQASEPGMPSSAQEPAPTGPYTPAEGEPLPAAPPTHSEPLPALVATARANPADYFRQVAELGIQAAEGLAYAHQRGVIHRDIKPSNLLLDDQGVLWITDFGLARRADDPALTHHGVLVGTPRYMSPEQAEAAKKPIDHRTDIYSLGTTLYELVTRRPAFTGPTPAQVVLQILEREPVPPRRLDPAVPHDLETIILKAMAKRPEDRYQTAAELADDLRRWLRLEPIRARRIGPLGRTLRWCHRNPALAAVSTSAALVILTLSTLYLWSLRREIANTRTAAEREREARQEAVSQREEALDTLAASLYHEARAQLTSRQPGRRWRALELVQEAVKLSFRERKEATEAPDAPDTAPTALMPGIQESRRLPRKLPTREDLRSVAVAALLSPDARVRHAEKLRPSLVDAAFSADGSQAAHCFSSEEGLQVSLLNLTDGREVAHWGARHG